MDAAPTENTRPDEFFDPLDLRKCGDQWIVLADFRFWSARLEKLIIVPKGFPTDLNSAFRWPVIYWLFGKTADAPAAVHDFLYRQQFVTRAVADLVFRDACAVARPPEPTWRRWAMWAGLAMFGWKAWREDRNLGPFDYTKE